MHRPESEEELISSPGVEVRWVNLRKEGPKLPGDQAALLALAQALVTWNNNNAFCGRTGAPTAPMQGGHARVAASPRARVVYPRIDPAVIALVSCGNYALLGRQARWAPGRYSCLAGFAEVGETLEQAVGREVSEESGIEVDPRSVCYVASQPWPFPQSLMIGFMASAAPPDRSKAWALARQRLQVVQHMCTEEEVASTLVEELCLQQPRVDVTELEDARWFHRSWLSRRLSPAVSAGRDDSELQKDTASTASVDFSIPGSYALAHRLIHSFMSSQQQPGEGNSSFWKQDVREVDIDEHGTYKYVLLRLESKDSSESRLLVRGNCRAGYHKDVLELANELDADSTSQLVPLGGGRIAFNEENKTISIYGYSSAYDQAPHDITAVLVRRSYPFHTVSVSYSGY
ncbi:g3935 [Coccomyxa elongata]